MPISKYHHLIPRTYLLPWANESGTLKVKNVHSGESSSRNIGHFGGVNHYHSIVAGMPICTEEDAKTIFASLEGLNVSYRGMPLEKPLELNQYYYAFDEWKITRTDGSPVSKKKLKNDIEQIKIQDIEEQWSRKYESRWPKVRDCLARELQAETQLISGIDFDYLMEMLTAMDWRSIVSFEEFNIEFTRLVDGILGLGSIDIPVDEQGSLIFENVHAYLRHCIILDCYRKYFNRTGLIWRHADANKKHTTFCFMVADDDQGFITSDNPVFVQARTDGLKEGLMPLTPRILMVQRKKAEDDNHYFVLRVDKKLVREYNRVITERADEYIVLAR